MVDFSTVSTDSCLLPILQAEPTRTPFVPSEAYMHNEASAFIFDICIGRETSEVGEGGNRCTRSGAYGRSQGYHMFLVNFLQGMSYILFKLFFILEIFVPRYEASKLTFTLLDNTRRFVNISNSISSHYYKFLTDIWR